jgi:chemotaxis protein CheC
MTFSRLDELQLDTLRELSNIGMGHAATALSQLLRRGISLHVPNLTVTDIAEVPDLLGGAEMVVAGITLDVLGGRGGISC